MADQRITELTELAQVDVAANDVLAIVDVGSSITKKVQAKSLFQAGANLADASSIDLAKLNQSSVTKIGTTALADDAVTAAKLANDSSISFNSVAPTTDNFEGRGYVNSTTSYLQVFNGSAFVPVVTPTAGIDDLAVTTAKLADNAVTTEKVDASGLGATALATDSVTAIKIASSAVTEAKIDTAAVTETKLGTDAVTTAKIAADAVTYAKLQNVTATDKLLGRSTAGAGDVEEITCTAAGRALLDDADASAQRTTLALGTIATQSAGAVAITGGTATGLSSLSATAATLSNTTITSGSITGITDLAVEDGGTGASDADTARTNLGIEIGTNVQPYNAALTSIGNLTTGANQAIYTTGADTYATTNITAYGRSIIDDTDAAGARTTLELGTLATQSGTFTGTHSGVSSGTNTGDQTITLTGPVTGTGTGSFATSIAAGAITATAIDTNAVTTAKIIDAAITAAKLADDSTAIVSAGTPIGTGDYEGQHWFDTNTSVEYVWTGAAWTRQAAINEITFTNSTPLGITVAYPNTHSAAITTTLNTQAANHALLGPTSGADAAPTFRAVEPADLPNATASTKGIVQPGTGLSVNVGVLNHTNSVSPGTYTKVTVDSVGHISAGTTLTSADIPSLDTAKITTGTFGTSIIADNAVTAAKIADYATASIGEGLPTASFIGQIHLNPLDRAFFMWDGNVYVPIGISAGQIILAGTFDASTPSGIGKIQSVTPDGAAAGFTVNSSLPVPTTTNNGYYFVVSEGGTITSGNAPNTTLTPPDLILSIYNATTPQWVEIDVSAGAGAIAAASVSFVPAGDIASVNVQTAIEEVSIECRNASNLTSGTVAVARGGTNVSSYTKGDLLAASASTTLTKLGVGTNGQVLIANSATATGLEWGTSEAGTVTTVSSSTGALTVATPTTTPALTIRAATTSVDGIVQLSDSTSTTSSVLAATPTAVKAAYDLANAALPKAGGIVTGALEIGSTGSLVFEGATDDAFETTLEAADPTADRTVTLPNATGTLISTGDTGTVTSAMIANGAILDADINASAGIVDTKLATITTAGKVSNSATTATSANTANGIVARDASGNFTAGTITANLTGTASNVTTNANLTGHITSSGNATVLGSFTSAQLSTALTDETGTGVAVFATSPSLTTPNIGAATGTSLVATGAAGLLTRAAATQDGIELIGRAGGTTSLKATIIPTTLTASRTFTLPNVTGTFVTTGDTGSVTSTMIANGTILDADVNASAAIAFSKLANVSATDRLLGRSTAGAGVVEEVVCTAAGRALIDDADAAAQRTTLGLGTIATVAAPAGTVVGTTDTQTLTNKTLTDPAIIGTILEDVFTITDGAAFEVDPGNGSVQLITLVGNRTPKATNFAAGESITLMVNDGTDYTLTWTDTTWGTGGVIWTGGTAPTLATTGYTVLQFWKVSTQVYGALVGNVA